MLLLTHRRATAGDRSGPDVSHWQGTINWQKVKSGGYGFAIAKATEGSSATDSQFKANWKVRHLKPTDVLNNYMSAEVLNEWPCVAAVCRGSLLQASRSEVRSRLGSCCIRTVCRSG